MRQQGMSYRQIAGAVGLHWTRVQQIVKDMEYYALRRSSRKTQGVVMSAKIHQTAIIRGKPCNNLVG
jgi:hypothetical protein